MHAMTLAKIASLRDVPEPLSWRELPDPEPGTGQVLLRVLACGVCHTELDEIEGRTPPPRLPIVPGHQVVGRVVAAGSGTARLRVGDRVGVGWIWCSSGTEDENLSEQFVATGRDVDGGYAELMVVPEDYACPLPSTFTDVEAAPLLCAGAVGYRALRLCSLRDGEPLGLTGFGASAHLVLQMARHRLPHSPVHVFARDPGQREFARALGACWAGDTGDRSPEPLAAVIDTTPAWRPVVEALRNLRPGGRLVINAISKEGSDQSELLRLRYHEHLWMEREIKTVANVTRADLRECLELAAAIPMRPTVTTYPLREANRALSDLAHGQARGARVLVVS
ncbi:MAG TPA: alcohol dehydrogenase catalytic domain-containing protein [Planctomycetota bacterium]|nr:alcohol dehydrogenase catalytic domain-containing protein [Planctomycetota bacterium]